MDLIIAIHEAGHAVAHRRLFPDTWFAWGLAIVPEDEQDERDAVGWSATEHLGNEDDLSPTDLDTCVCAGYGAVIAAGYNEDQATAGCDEESDECDFRRVRGDLAAARVRAIELMRQPENVKAVKRLADELMLRRQLHGDHVGLLIDVADGEITESEYQQHLGWRGWNHNGPTLLGDGY